MQPDYTYRAKLKKIVDADTIDVIADLGFSVFTEQRLRIARIDAWEVRGEERPKGLIAKERVTQLLLNENFESKDLIIVTIKDSKGKYGRYIAEVYFDLHGELTNLSDLLVKEEHAEKYG